MRTGCYETSLLLFANARGAGTLLTVKCPAPGTHGETNAGVCPGGGMLAVGIDSHIKTKADRLSVCTVPHSFRTFVKTIADRPCVYTIPGSLCAVVKAKEDRPSVYTIPHSFPRTAVKTIANRLSVYSIPGSLCAVVKAKEDGPLFTLYCIAFVPL